jgi:EpsI family protein
MTSLASYLRPLSIKPMHLVLALFIMLGGLTAAELLLPSRYWSAELGNPVYDKIIPAQFGDWSQVPGAGGALVNPVQAEMIDKIYSETLSRVYVNRKTGRAVMLSIAYGRDQSTDTQLHTPDMCYPSQGFKVEPGQAAVLKTHWGDIPTVQMHTALGQRREPLTYFIRTGDQVTTQGSLDRNLARLGMALRGYRIDGLLVRVSEVTRQDDAFAQQQAFVLALLAHMPPADRPKLIGRMGSTAR